MQPSDYINIILLLVTAVGVFAAFRQIMISNKQKRADSIIQLYNIFTSDDDMMDIYYKIEYGNFNYDEKTFHQSEDEKKLDKLLGMFSNIGQLYLMGIVKEKDLDFIKYEFQIIYENPEVQKYFETLDFWFDRRQIAHLKFEPFRQLGKELSEDNYKRKKRNYRQQKH